jgi:hypothetical protein
MANPLKAVGQVRPAKESPHEIAARMNLYTTGKIPGHKGEFIEKPRFDIRWMVRDGKCVIEWAA